MDPSLYSNSKSSGKAKRTPEEEDPVSSNEVQDMLDEYIMNMTGQEMELKMLYNNIINIFKEDPTSIKASDVKDYEFVRAKHKESSKTYQNGDGLAAGIEIQRLADNLKKCSETGYIFGISTTLYKQDENGSLSGYHPKIHWFEIVDEERFGWLLAAKYKRGLTVIFGKWLKSKKYVNPLSRWKINLRYNLDLINDDCYQYCSGENPNMDTLGNMMLDSILDGLKKRVDESDPRNNNEVNDDDE